jgi:tetratricopeptide (TPR) repeat protein
MVSMSKQLDGKRALLVGLLIQIFLASCVVQPPKKEEKPVDIYESIRNDVIQYRHEPDQQRAIVQAGSDYINNQINQVRELFFQKDYEQASQLAERLVRQAPNNPDAYYWLARIRLEVADYDQASQMALKGLSVSQKGSNVRKELQRVQQQAMIGAN